MEIQLLKKASYLMQSLKILEHSMQFKASKFSAGINVDILKCTMKNMNN